MYALLCEGLPAHCVVLIGPFFFLNVFFLLQGGVPKQVLLRPGLQVPPLHLREHPGGEVRGLSLGYAASSN